MANLNQLISYIATYPVEKWSLLIVQLLLLLGFRKFPCHSNAFYDMINFLILYYTVACAVQIPYIHLYKIISLKLVMWEKRFVQ